MTFRSEGDIIYAANAARDLNNLVVAYLTLFKKYTQGMNDVRVPDGNYTVVILPQNTPRKLRVKLVSEEVSSYESPVYADNGGYEEPEFGSYGSTGQPISHYETVFTERTVDQAILIPIPSLLQSKEKMEESMKRFAENEKKRLQEIERQSKIAAHQEAIRQLQGKSP